MDLVSFDSSDEYRHFAKIMYRGNNVKVIVIVSICPPEHANLEDDKLHICAFIFVVSCFAMSLLVTHKVPQTTIALHLPNLYAPLCKNMMSEIILIILFCRQHHCHVDKWTQV